MPTDGSSSCAAVTLDGIGSGVGVGVGLAATVADGRGVGVVRATGLGLGVVIGGRLGVVGSSRSRVPAIMSTTPATPRMIGSAHDERRFTWPSLAA